MSFVDIAQVVIQAGDGGDGHLSFRHEKFVDRGGPNGGDGGKGGDVVFAASRNQNTLARFRFQKKLKAQSGNPGGKQNRHGKNGQDLLVPVPVGTIVLDEAGAVIIDFNEDGQQEIVARGGSGGFGNAHFVSSTRQAPRIAEKGEAGQELTLSLELKLIADVGLIGLPNAGKSTLLSVLTNSRPRIADYPFTTLEPNLGVVDLDESNSLLLADIPGLIEGAAAGKGLGDEFLRHVERTKVLVHVIDAYQDDIVKAYQTIQTELKSYKIDLSSRPQIIAINKVEGLPPERITALRSQLRKAAGAKLPILAISAQAKQGLPKLLATLSQMVIAMRAEQQAQKAEDSNELPIIRLETSDTAWHIERQDNDFQLTGMKIERFAARTDFASTEGTARLRDIMRRMGIMHELARQGAKPGAKIRIGSHGSIEY